MTHFGPAGNSNSFYDKGYKSTTQAPEYLFNMGLNAYEYQCGRGVKVNADTAQTLRENAEKFGVKLSLHAPYFISLSSVEEETRLKSIDYILQSARAADLMGADRIIVHSGSCSKITREEALNLAKDTLALAQKALDENNLSHIHICPETMGKVNQLGTLEEVIELCKVSERFIPCVDFGHLNARTFGGIKTADDYDKILTLMQDNLGERAKTFHSHFSKIEYTTPGGEKRHLTFEDTTFGPDFSPLAEVLVRKGFTPTIICESDGTQAEDAKQMNDMYKSAKEKIK